MVDNGTAIQLSGVEGATQIVRNVLATYRGEWFADISFGVNWLGILRGELNIPQAVREIRTQLLAVNGIDRVVDIVFGQRDDSQRNYTLAAIVQVGDEIIRVEDSIA